ncbi:MAG TPA: histidine phosphatase family protein [Acidimicrobiales bacterium]
MSGLLLVRHAQSVWNATGRWQGWANPPLSPIGEEQARRAAVRLAGAEPFELVVTSDLVRAVRTAEILATELSLPGPINIEPGLREYNVGAWSGCTAEQIEARWPGGVARFAQGEPPPDGEDRATFDTRVIAAGRRVAQMAGAARLLVVAHGGVVRAVARAAGVAEYRVGHLAGYWGEHDEGGLFPKQAVNLQDDEVDADAGEGAVAPVT